MALRLIYFLKHTYRRKSLKVYKTMLYLFIRLMGILVIFIIFVVSKNSIFIKGIW